jgi:hypothetical protein
MNQSGLRFPQLGVKEILLQPMVAELRISFQSPATTSNPGANTMSTYMPNYQPMPSTQAPQPPAMHWGVVLALSVVTIGLFSFFWAYKQASFARKIDPLNPATRRATFQVLVSLMLMLFSILLGVISAWTVMRGGQPTDLTVVTNMIHMFQFLTFTVAIFTIRTAVTACYGVRLNPILTFFFNVFYLQYHLTQIARFQLPYTAPAVDSGQPGSPVMQSGR